MASVEVVLIILSCCVFRSTSKKMPENQYKIKLCARNTRGLVASIPYLRALCTNYDIVCMTDHWLHHNRLQKLGDIAEDMNYFGRSSLHSSSENYGYHKGHGGVAILWNNKLCSAAPLCKIQHDRFCAIHLHCKNGSVINIFSIYLPARGCADDLEITLDEISATLDNTETGSYNILCGDFNADLGAKGGSKSSKVPDKRGLTLLRFVNKYDLRPVNLFEQAIGPLNTHYGPTGESCIDYLMVPETICQYFSDCKTHSYAPLNTSDHLPVSITLEIGGIPCGAIQGVATSKHRWDKMSHDDLINLYQIPLSSNLDSLYRVNVHSDLDCHGKDCLIENIVTAVKTHEKSVPRSHYRKNVKPYWCPESNDLKFEKVRAYKAWRDAGQPRDQNNPLYIANKNSKKVLGRGISKEYDEEKIQEAINSAEVNHNIFWKLLKREKDGPKVKTPSIKNSVGIVIHDLQAILEVWRLHFSNLGTPVTSANFDSEHYEFVNT